MRIRCTSRRLGFGILLLTLGCDTRPSLTGLDAGPANVLLSVTEITLPPGFRSQLDVAFRRNDGAMLLGDVAATWRSSNPAVAVVVTNDPRIGATPRKPVIEAVATGSATVSVQAGVASETVDVNVAPLGGLLAFTEFDPARMSDSIRVTSLDGSPGISFSLKAPGAWGDNMAQGLRATLSLAPDGKRLVYTCADPTGMQPALCLADLGVRGPENAVVLGGSEAGDPAWSLDGTKIVFVKNGELVELDVAGRGEQYLGLSGWSPRFSPDGTEIAYGCVDGVCLARSDGTGADVVSYAPLATKDVNWSQDGREVFYRRELSPGIDVVMAADINGTAERQLTEVPAGGGPVLWSLDRSWLMIDGCLRRVDGRDQSCLGSGRPPLAADWIQGTGPSKTRPAR